MNIRSCTNRTALAAVAALALSAPAQALVIDFEGIAAGTCLALPSISTQGFDFTSAALNFYSCDGTRVDLPSNGTQAIGSESPSVTTMAVTGGGIFSLNSIDLAELFVATPAGHQVQIDGNLQGGGLVSTTFTLDGTNDGPGGSADFETFVLPGTFVNLTSVVLTGLHQLQADARFTFDNVVVNNVQRVPEPGLALWLGAGLVAAGSLRRSRRGS